MNHWEMIKTANSAKGGVLAVFQLRQLLFFSLLAVLYFSLSNQVLPRQDRQDRQGPLAHGEVLS